MPQTVERLRQGRGETREPLVERLRQGRGETREPLVERLRQGRGETREPLVEGAAREKLFSQVKFSDLSISAFDDTDFTLDFLEKFRSQMAAKAGVDIDKTEVVGLGAASVVVASKVYRDPCPTYPLNRSLLSTHIDVSIDNDWLQMTGGHCVAASDAITLCFVMSRNTRAEAGAALVGVADPL
ncbi:hypothetical protein CYMTET_4981 [Cymbomonas tetramitiformis]|uniref:Uncharacterized protein n=1 Tax=Cymbomonas tetramitiformis TaxID=36881 RepID=A0AAE0H045_9CHLO|nr:hypothetical protein CYMTET_4981 [Cymbomonas tetramitiformis]